MTKNYQVIHPDQPVLSCPSCSCLADVLARARSVAAEDGCAFFANARPDAENHGSLLFHSPSEILELTPSNARAGLAHLDSRLRDGRLAAGWLAYEANAVFSPVPGRAGDRIGSFGIYDGAWLFDHETAEWRPEGEPPALPAPLAAGGAFALSPLLSALSFAAYRPLVERIHEAIRDGATYQVNLTFPLRFALEGEVFSLFAELLEKQPVPYASFQRWPGLTVLSLSPELFFQREGERLWTRPMKGTVARAADPAEDAARGEWLVGDPKNRAENVMIVDLMRNDLGRVGRDIRVTRLCEVETHPTLRQMTSTVECRPQPDAGLAEVLAALFPAGSVTGAPKISTMRLIHALEAEPRGVYCGALGYALAPDRYRVSVPIRTLTHDHEWRLSVGSGLTIDSEPAAEYAECLLKADFLRACGRGFALIETMRRLADGGFPLLDRHLARLADSATRLGLPCDLSAIRARLLALPRSGHDERLRCLLSPDGEARIETHRFEAALSWRVRLAEYPNTHPPFWRGFKSTLRHDLNRLRETGRETGWDETWMRRDDRLAEGTISSLILIIRGRALTPPLSAGILPGVMRQWLIDNAEVEEAVLTCADLARAEAAWSCNAVQGMVPVVEIEEKGDILLFPKGKSRMSPFS